MAGRVGARPPQQLLAGAVKQSNFAAGVERYQDHTDGVQIILGLIMGLAQGFFGLGALEKFLLQGLV